MSAKILKVGVTSEEVAAWQTFLKGFFPMSPLVVTGTFDTDTERETGYFQRIQGLLPDGMVGPETYKAAVQSGFPAPNVRVSTDFPVASWKPMTAQEKSAVFGDFNYRPAPTTSNPEGIQILGNWVSENIVSVHIPQLKGIPGAPLNCTVAFHRKASDQLKSLWAAWESAGLLPLVLTFAGTWNPRFIRGSRTVLSNHAFATAFDINVAWNALGAKPAPRGARGSVADLLPLAFDHGFQWGGNFRRTDGMHFEVGKLI